MIEIINNTIRKEGGYINDDDDRGGETYKGISRRWFPKWAGWGIIDNHKKDADFKDKLDHDSNLSKMVYSFYYHEFYKGYEIFDNLLIREELFDTSVNLGKKTAIKIMQKALNMLNRNEKNYEDLVVDGEIGSKTIHAYSKCNHAKLLKTLNGIQFMHYFEIAENDKTQEKYFNGWLNRV